MTRSIWRFNLSNKGLVAVEGPPLLKILLVHSTSSHPAIWAEVYPEAATSRHVFAVVPTGEQPPENGSWVGSAYGYPARHIYQMPSDTPIPEPEPEPDEDDADDDYSRDEDLDGEPEDSGDPDDSLSNL